MLQEKLAIIGAGNMGEALLKGLLEANIFLPQQIIAVEVNDARRGFIQKEYEIAVSSDPLWAVGESNIVLLAVKPQIMGTVLGELASALDRSKLIISVVAGKKIKFLQDAVGENSRIIRVMPNTPALVQAGMSAVCGSEGLSPADLEIAKTIFGAVGKVVEVDESLMDAVTALSGSGPAYVFVMIEALADAGVSLGLARDVALTLAAQTVFGSAKLLLDNNEHPAKLKDMVSSPGGTTIAGLQALEEGGIRATLISAVQAAAKRSQELGK